MMTPETTLQLRKRELERRTVDLPREVEDWQNRIKNVLDENIHWSQMQAIKALMDAYKAAQDDILAQFPPATDKTGSEDALFKLLNAIVAAQRAWNFFRSKFDLRTIEIF